MTTSGTFYSAAQTDAQLAAQAASVAATYSTLERPISTSVAASFTLPGGYDRQVQLYNAKPKHAAPVRAKIGRLLNAQSLRLKVLCLGDSNLEGDGAGDKSIHSQPAALNKLVVGYGLPDAGTGLVFMRRDERWTRNNWAPLNASTPYFRHGYKSVDTTQAFFLSDKSGESIDVWYDGTSTSVGVRLDDAAPITTLPATANTVEKYTITGLGNTKHSIALIPTAAGAIVYGIEVYRTSGVSVTNAALSGSTSNEWSPTVTGNDAPVKLAVAWGPDIVYINLGTNDGGTAVSVATFKTNITAIVGAFPNAVVVLGVPLPRSLDISAWRQACYELADTLDVNLFDPNDRLGLFADATALGQFFDTLHINAAASLDVARGIAAACALPIGNQTPATPAAVPSVGTSLIRDTFTRADGALGTTETGSKTWQFQGGTASIASGQVVINTVPGASNGLKIVTDTAFADCAMEATVYGPSAGATGFGVTFREDFTAQTGWTVEAYGGTTWTLLKHTTSTFTTVATSSVTATPGQRLRVEMNGSSIVVKVGGVTILTATDAFNATKTLHGFYTRYTSRYFDDYDIRSLT